MTGAKTYAGDDPRVRCRHHSVSVDGWQELARERASVRLGLPDHGPRLEDQ